MWNDGRTSCGSVAEGNLREDVSGTGRCGDNGTVVKRRPEDLTPKGAGDSAVGVGGIDEPNNCRTAAYQHQNGRSASCQHDESFRVSNIAQLLKTALEGGCSPPCGLMGSRRPASRESPLRRCGGSPRVPPLTVNGARTGGGVCSTMPHRCRARAVVEQRIEEITHCRLAFYARL